MMRRVALALLGIAVVAAAVAGRHAGDPAAGPTEGSPREAPTTDEGASPPPGRADDARQRARAATGGASANAGPAPQGSVTGTVARAGDGAPVAGAEVRLWRQREPPRAPRGTEDLVIVADGLDAPPDAIGTTDSAGRFAIDVAGGAPVRVVVTAPGFAQRQEGVAPGDPLRIYLSLVPATRWVVVEEGTSRAIPGAVVRAFDLLCPGALPCATVTCDAGGRGEAHLPVDTFLLFSAEGFASRWERLSPCEEAEDRHEIPLPRAAEIAGEVVDPTGRPVAGARVSCDSFAVGEGWPLVAETVAAARFRFVVPDDEEPRALAAEAAGFAPGLVHAAPGETQVRIVLHPAAWIEGVAVDERGVPVEGFAAEVDDAKGRVTGRGAFEIGPLPPGVHEVDVESVRDGATAWGQTAVALRAGERRTGVRVVVQSPPAPSETRVRVTDPAGVPVPDVAAFWIGREWTQQRTDGSGLATIRAPGPPGAPGTLAAAITDARPWVPGPSVEAPAGAPGDERVVALTVLPATRVRVRVLGPDGDEVAVRLGVEGVPGARLVGPDLLVADGARFALTVGVEGHARRRIACSASEVVDGVLTVRIPRAPVLRGRVAIEGDAPPMRLRVAARVVRGPRDVVSAEGEAADADGAFALAGLPAGEGTLEVRVSDVLLWRTPFAMGREDLDLGVVRIGPFARLTGVAVDDRGIAVPRASVRASGDGFSSFGETDAAGRFEVVVPEGRLAKVGASRDDDLVAAPLETTTAHDASPLTIRLQRPARVLVHASFAEQAGVAVTARPAGGGAEMSLGTSNGGSRPPAFGIRVPPGAWDLSVRFEGREWTRPLTVGPGDVAEVTLDE